MNFEEAISKINVEEKRTHNLKLKLYTALCHKSGTFITQKRILIIEALCCTPNVIDVENTWINLREKFDINRAAIYNVLRVLVEKGIVTKHKKNIGYDYRFVQE